MQLSNYRTKVISNYRTKVKFNQDIHGRKAGAVELIQTSKDGIILDMQVRRRLKDNDGSVEILEQKASIEILGEKVTIGTAKKDIVINDVHISIDEVKKIKIKNKKR